MADTPRKHASASAEPIILATDGRGIPEPEVDSALAKAGRELIAAPNTPALLERFCRLTTELLGCDYSCTLLWCAEDAAYVPAACFGATPEEWEAVRTLKLSRESVSGFLEQLERGTVVQLSTPASAPGPLALLTSKSQSIHVALQHGDEMIGFHCAGYRGRPRAFTSQQAKIAHGTAQLAALALERTRLVEDLERASSLKSEFVATMSHELRTPLNIILGYTDLLLEQAFGALAPEQTEALQRIEKGARELLELINVTLDLSRLEAGRMTLDVRETYVPDLVHQVELETRPLQHKPRFNFVLHVAPALPPLHTDPVKLKLVLKNLVVNALKFTDEGSVLVDVYGREGGLELCVADTGIGIPPEALPLIFEPFRQAHAFKTRRQGGVGLGLYIVRRLVDMLGGSISVDSELGRGSIFRVWIPNQVPPGTAIGSSRGFNA